jgi:hypothetical protein
MVSRRDAVSPLGGVGFRPVKVANLKGDAENESLSGY